MKKNADFRYHIGIDTGVNTGLSIWDSKQKKMLTLITCKQWHAMKIVYNMVRGNNLEIDESEGIKLHIEDARKRGGYNKSAAQGAGSVKRSGQIWEEFCLEENIEHILLRPGTTKLDKHQFEMRTKISKRTSNHARDAAMIVFGI